MINISTRIRQRLRDELAHRKVSQRSAAQQLTRLTDEPWTQSRVHKVLAGVVRLQVDDLAAFAYIAGLSLVDLVREPGRELVADLTPSELHLLHTVRDNPQITPAILQLLTHQRRQPTRRTIRERMASDED